MDDYEITRGEHRAASQVFAALEKGEIAVGDFEDIAQRYRNYRKIPENTLMEKVNFENHISDFLGNCNWVAESRTYSGNAKERMKWFFLDAIEERIEAQMGECEVGDMEWFEQYGGWEGFRNTNLQTLRFVSQSKTPAHDFWFATTKGQTDDDGKATGYAHNWSMENNDKYYHRYMMKTDADYKAAFEAEEAAKEDA